MNWLKKFWIAFISFLPISAGAFWPFLLGGVGGGIIGYSIYRSVSPVNLTEALDFFSTCWSCQIFSDVVARMSSVISSTYSVLGGVIIPVAIALMAIWLAWDMFSIYALPGKGQVDGWSIAGRFGVRMVKIMVISALLLVPLPRMISSMFITPIFDIGLSMNHALDIADMRQNYASCVIATAIADKDAIDADSQSQQSVFTPRFRHNLTCQIANVHQMTGLGITVGWAMLNMAFNYDNTHKILWAVPIFPNVPLLITGLLILVLYFCALLPIPLYFLEIFINLAMDFVLLPLTLLSWVFQGWTVFPSGGGNIKQTINDVISGALGLALTGIFITFSIMVLNIMFGNWEGASILQSALAQNDSKMLVDGLLETTGNTALVTLILMGIFMTMFMTMIPALIKSLFNVSVSDNYFQTAKKDLGLLWQGAQKWWKAAKK